jgi:hypothetical protein
VWSGCDLPTVDKAFAVLGAATAATAPTGGTPNVAAD